MNMYRFLTTAAAGSALLAAVAPSAQAFDLGGALSSTAQTAAAAGAQAGPAVDGALGGKARKKVGAVKDAVQAGADAVKAGNDLVN
ncbi:hypothetical protein [Streptomyces sp. NPDC051569]|uniref:hypothetical protein n=1 Tax=Streptomyces sp. NPDC051569 TaxID=3365661 RepID=UPI00379D96A7